MHGYNLCVFVCVGRGGGGANNSCTFSKVIRPPLHPLQPLGPDTLPWCGGMVGSLQRERAGIGGRLRCHSFAMPSNPMLSSVGYPPCRDAGR